MKTLSRRKAEVSEYGKAKVEFAGVSLVEFLEHQGVAFGKELKGPRASIVCLVEAADGYRVAISLLEMDPTTTDKMVLLVDQRDGQPLGEKEGPFRLVVPDDKRQIRGIRMIRTMRILNLKDIPLREIPGRQQGEATSPSNSKRS